MLLFITDFFTCTAAGNLCRPLTFYHSIKETQRLQMKKSNEEQAMELLCECLQLPSDSTMEELMDSMDKLTTEESEYL